MTTQSIGELLKSAFPTSHLREHAIFSFENKDYEAEWYLETESTKELAEAVRLARQHALPVSILGSGFIPDDIAIIPGIVIKNNCRKFDMLSMRGVMASGQPTREVTYVLAESGVPLNQLVRYTVDEGLAGLEGFLGLPGTLGDALMRNLKYEKEDVFLTSRIFSLSVITKESEVLETTAEPFLYPLSDNIFMKKQLIPLSVVFTLTPSDKSELWKRATQAAFERNQEDLTDPLKGNFNY